MIKGESGQRSRYRVSLRVGRFGDRIPVGARFRAFVKTCPGAHPASCTVSISTGVKKPGREVVHPPISRVEVKERVELYFCPHSGLLLRVV